MPAGTTPFELALVLVAGLVAGFVNTLAGGASALTVPALMVLGLPADLANGTNRVSVVAQTLAGALAYDAGGALDRAAVVRIAAPTLGGAVAGAIAVSRVPNAILEPLLLGTMIAVAGGMLRGGARSRPDAPAPPSSAATSPSGGRVRHLLALVTIGFYGGFVQAGVGLLLIAYLSRGLGYGLVRANALKTVVIFVFSSVALWVFVLAGQVRWAPALVLSAATVLGARLGVRYALAAKERSLERVVFAMVVVTCLVALVR